MITKKISIFILLLFTTLSVFADKVNVRLSTPSVARVGQQIRLAVEANDKVDKVNLPALKAFEVMMGPMTSSSSSVQIINGKSSRSSSYSYTYILKPKKVGVFTVPAVEVVIDGKRYKTNSRKIEIVKGNANANTTSSGSEISKKDLFVKVFLSRTNVREGEAILATTKLYTRVPISGVSDIQLPSFTGFYTKPVGEIRHLRLNQEAYDGDIYNTSLLNKTLLFPQKDGSLKIEPAKVTVQVQQQVRRAQGLFDDFFNSTRTVTVDVQSASRVVRVKGLPTAPDSYSGAVGQFHIMANISEDKVKANDAITLRLTIKGKGNLSLVTAPKLDFPEDFETYDPQTKNSIKVTDSGEVGSKTLEYLVQPRFAGTYTIPSVSFSYYDPAKGKFVTKETETFHIEVAKGEGKGSAPAMVNDFSKESVKTVGKDIRFISTDDVKFSKKHSFFGTLLFYMLYVIGVIAFVILYLMNLKRIREREDVWGTKNKKANRLALKRLKKASDHLKRSEDELFYEAVLVALMGYLEDKLTLPKSELTKETIVASLAKRKVAPEDVDALISLVDTCEFARYAPSQDHGAQEDIYQRSVNVLSMLEKSIKK
ncbi:BatD family protein [Halosquirtibacter laminarini]|uniref:BatD family protein n=1 Tax=Halosquirtibacter laminarini TaxID=3374600 RepID=A0AC61NI16_9BACT|nr:BatD family protein [Prolixibacteraceae bacterium]